MRRSRLSFDPPHPQYTWLDAGKQDFIIIRAWNTAEVVILPALIVGEDKKATT